MSEEDRINLRALKLEAKDMAEKGADIKRLYRLVTASVQAGLEIGSKLK